ncbi:hypothetical protein M9458_053152, partial [Cirrhinus mrigala]
SSMVLALVRIVTGSDLAWYGPDPALYWTRTGMEPSQIRPSFGPNHHIEVHIWAGAGPVLVQMQKNGSEPVLTRCAKGDRPESVVQIWPRTFDG